MERDFENDTSLEESKLEDEALSKIKRKLSDLPMDPVQMMEMNLANISAIQPRSPMQLYLSKMDEELTD